MADTKPDECPGNPANSANSTAGEFPGFPGPVLTEPTPLSVVARQLALADREQYDRWWEAGAPGHPRIASSRHDTSQRRLLEPPPPLAERGEALKRADRERFLRDRALGLMLEAVQRYGLRVSGIGPRGLRIEIDRLLLPHLVFELEHDRARTADGTCCWLALEVAPAPRPPRAPNRQRGFLDWYRTAYPDGHPAGKKLEALAHEAAGALACRISTRTIRRALRDPAQRTKAAR